MARSVTRPAVSVTARLSGAKPTARTRKFDGPSANSRKRYLPLESERTERPSSADVMCALAIPLPDDRSRTIPVSAARPCASTEPPSKQLAMTGANQRADRVRRTIAHTSRLNIRRGNANPIVAHVTFDEYEEVEERDDTPPGFLEPYLTRVGAVLIFAQPFAFSLFSFAQSATSPQRSEVQLWVEHSP